MTWWNKDHADMLYTRMKSGRWSRLMFQYIFSNYKAVKMVFLYVSEASFSYVNTMYYSPNISYLHTLWSNGTNHAIHRVWATGKDVCYDFIWFYDLIMCKKAVYSTVIQLMLILCSFDTFMHQNKTQLKNELS